MSQVVSFTTFFWHSFLYWMPFMMIPFPIFTRLGNNTPSPLTCATSMFFWTCWRLSVLSRHKVDVLELPTIIIIIRLQDAWICRQQQSCPMCLNLLPGPWSPWSLAKYLVKRFWASTSTSSMIFFWIIQSVFVDELAFLRRLWQMKRSCRCWMSVLSGSCSVSW